MGKIYRFWLFNLIFVISLVIILDSCKKDKVLDDLVNNNLPKLTTTAANNITIHTAFTGGTITADGGSAVTDRGVCYSSTNNTPTTSDPYTIDSFGLGTFLSKLDNLTASTTYYVRAYASNFFGTAYGNTITFKTRMGNLPVLTTTSVSNITYKSASSGGNITSIGGSPVTARGVCCGTEANPVVTGNHTTDGTGSGTFTSNITGLSPTTTYYVRAYATNDDGTAYGNSVNFNTLDPPPGDLEIFVVDNIGTSYYGGADVYLYKSDADRTNDPQRTNYFQKASTGTTDPSAEPALFSNLPVARYYLFCSFYWTTTMTGTADILVVSGKKTQLKVSVK